LPRNAQKHTKQKARKKNRMAGGWVGLGFTKFTGGSVEFDFFCRPPEGYGIAWYLVPPRAPGGARALPSRALGLVFCYCRLTCQQRTGAPLGLSHAGAHVRPMSVVGATEVAVDTSGSASAIRRAPTPTAARRAATVPAPCQFVYVLKVHLCIMCKHWYKCKCAAAAALRPSDCSPMARSPKHPPCPLPLPSVLNQ
jgi:hypothetical protein